MAAGREARLQVEEAVRTASERARRATEFATAASLRIQSPRRFADLSGDGCRRKRWRHQARHAGVNPQGCQVFSFKHPSAAELQHDFLWRTTRDLPERGRIGIFNRSYYEEVLIARVHPEILCSEGIPDAPQDDKTVWHDRYRSITNLERHLHENGTRIVKFFLHLSKDEQRKRFLERIDEPEKNWKFSLADIEERKFWKHYMKAYEQCLGATSTSDAPWYAVPADDKENARLIVSQTNISTPAITSWADPMPSRRA